MLRTEVIMNQDASIKKYALITVTMASFLIPFMGSAVNLAIPSIGGDFNSSALLLSWVVSSYLLASAAFLLPFGRFADILGRKKVFISGVAVFSLSSLLCGIYRHSKIPCLSKKGRKKMTRQYRADPN